MLGRRFCPRIRDVKHQHIYRIDATMDYGQLAHIVGRADRTIDPQTVVACEGRVTRKDYDDVLVPAVTTALQRYKKIRLFYEITPQFSGIEAGAIWEDFRIGMEHLLRWERVAVVTDIEWIRHTVKRVPIPLPGENPRLRRRRS